MTSPLYVHVVNLDTVGGVETLFTHYLSSALSDGKAIHCTCVSGKRPHPFISEQLIALGHAPFLEQYAMKIRIPRFLRFFVGVRRGIIEDLVHPTYWVFWNRIEKEIPPGPSAYYEHGAAWTDLPGKMQKEFLQHCSLILANSSAAALMLREKWGINRPIHVVPNPLRPDLPIATTPKVLPSSRPIRLGFIGRLVPIKGLLVAIHTLKKLLDKKIDATLSIAGVGEQEKVARKQCEEMGISQAVEWKGCVSDVATFYDNIDLLLVPSIREPLGLVALEAAARGVPVIASCVDGLPEAVCHNKTGLCLSPTLPIRVSPLLPSLTGLPDLVIDPLRATVVTPKLLDPDYCAEEIFALIHDPERYALMSTQSLSHAASRADFAGYHRQMSVLLEPKDIAEDDIVSDPLES